MNRALLACALSVGLGGPVRAAPDEPTNAQQATLSGRWLYDADLSDDAREKLRPSMPGPSGEPMGPRGGGPAGAGRRPPTADDGQDAEPGAMMRPILQPAEELTITQSDREIVIDEHFGRTRTLRPDGRFHKTDNGTAEVRCEWRGGRLLVETKRASGPKVGEVWERSATGSRLTAVFRVDTGVGSALKLKRVYDRAPETKPAR